jgi:pimeloyl-ACP methyl ester carboxylesterase
VEIFKASDGAQLAYYIDDFTDPWNKAPILLLLHAAMGSARRYFAWVPPLSRHYRVVRMDLRGHGNSPVPSADRELTLDRLVADVAELIDHIDCPSAHIVGNSAGGYLGQQLAMNMETGCAA